MINEMNNETIKSAHIGRRAVLCGALAIAFGLSADIAGDIASASTPAIATKQIGKKIQVTLAKNKSLLKVGGAVTIALGDGSSVAVVRTTSAVNGFVAMNLSCTHQGVTVVQQGTSWNCPAHGSSFSNTGKVLRGPANQALFKYPIAATAKTVTIG